MVISQKRSKRKSTSGRYKKHCKKRLHEKGNLPTLTKLGERKLKTVKARGKTTKAKLLSENKVNLLDPKTKKYSSETIEAIEETLANRNYARRKIITKGTIIKTKKGKAKVTSRPAQEGIVNAVLV